MKLFGAQSTLVFDVLNGIFARFVYVTIETESPLFDEHLIQLAAAFEFSRHCHGKDGIRAWQNLQVHSALLGNSCSFRIDGHHFRAFFARYFDDSRKVQIRNRYIISPDNNQIRMNRLLRWHSWCRTEQA